MKITLIGMFCLSICKISFAQDSTITLLGEVLVSSNIIQTELKKTARNVKIISAE